MCFTNKDNIMLNTGNASRPSVEATPLLGFDPDGEVFTANGRIFRGIYSGKAQKVKMLLEFYNKCDLSNYGIVETRIVDDTLFKHMGYDLLLEHRRIPFISYVYEWSPSMIKDAALFQLSLNKKLIEHGLVLKDCGSTTNLLFDGSIPKHVDFLSITKLESIVCEYWLKPVPVSHIQHAFSQIALYFYEIFKKIFYPGMLYALLMLHNDMIEQAYYRLRNTMLNTAHDAITEEEVLAQLDAPSRYLIEKTKIYKESALLKNDFSRFIDIQFNEISMLDVSLNVSRYSDYYDSKEENYSFTPSSDWKMKQIGLYAALTKHKPATVLDIGANTGWFSILAAKKGAKVVSIDNDLACIDILYRRAKKENLNILPLYVDVLNPSPSIPALYDLKNDPHMLNSKFSVEAPLLLSIDKRLTCDMVIALALIHHMCLGAGRHINEVIEQLALYAQKCLVLEFVTKDDPLVLGEPPFFQAHYQNPHKFTWYTFENCIYALKNHFTDIEQTILIESRILLVCTGKIKNESY